ncbi:MAG: ASPIC/UnbV domain-containing protein [Planctomycetota bacterium]
MAGRPGNTDALGAVVKVRIAQSTHVRCRTSGGSYLSQHDSRIHFGLGPHEKVDLLEVIWPDGSRQAIKNVAADRLLIVRQQPARGAEQK